MFKRNLAQASIICLMALMTLSQTAYAQSPDTLRTGTFRENASPSEDLFWRVFLRVGYPLVSKNSFHPVSSGSYAVSGGFYVQPWELLSLGVDLGYQAWQNKREGDADLYGYHSHPYSLWNLTAGAAIHASSFFQLRQIDPFLMITLGLYGRGLKNGDSSSQMGPGLSYGIGISYVPEGLRFETGTSIGLNLVIRRHTMLLDDYGAWFAGPSHYWTKTVEVAAGIVVSW
jgi:hypothetical protein